MLHLSAFVAQQAALMAEAERQGRDVSMTVTRLLWFYSEKTGADYVQLAEAVMKSYCEDYRGNTKGGE